MGNGWFKSPRTLPLILALLFAKELTAGRDISRVYLELLESWGQAERSPVFRRMEVGPVPQVRVRSLDANLGGG